MDQHMTNSNLGSDVMPDFSFAFNNKIFSDRQLLIEIMPDLQRQSYDNKDAISHVGNSMKMDCSNSASRVRIIYINSAILAEKSPFFKTLFSNGMRESMKENATIYLSHAEEAAFMDLLQFIYRGILEARSATELLDLLMVAEKFGVKSCVNHCTHALQNSSPFTIKSALFFLQLRPTMLANTVLLQLTDAANRFLIQCFKHTYKDKLVFQDELLNLPLTVIEMILSRDELPVSSEDVLYDFVIKWARKHYPNSDERKEILGNKLCHLIRFPNMSLEKLREVVSCDDLDNMCSTKAVIEALFMKAEAPQKIVRFNRRAYQQKPFTVVQYDAPHPYCMAVWKLHKDDCQLFKDTPTLDFQDFIFEGLKFRPVVYHGTDIYRFSVGFLTFDPKGGEHLYSDRSIGDLIRGLDENTIILHDINAEIDDGEDVGRIELVFEVLSNEYRVFGFVHEWSVAHPKSFLSRGVILVAPQLYGPAVSPHLYIDDIIYFRLWLILHP